MLNVLVGAHGVGKTTLLEQLKEKDTSFYITDGFARPVRRALGDNSNPALEQRLINELTLHAWKGWLGQNVVAGRSLIDVMIYTTYYRPGVEIGHLQDFFDKTKEKAKYFYIPIEFELEDDGERYIDTNDQKNIDKELRLFLKEKGLTFTLIKGTMDQRLSILRENLIYTLS